MRLFWIDLNSSAEPVVLLLHGLGATSESWQLQIPVLIEHGYRVLAPDLPGFGRSPYASEWKSVSEVTTSISDDISHLNIHSAIVVGISMGGVVSLQLALDHPQFIERLVLVNTFAHLNVISPKTTPYYITRWVLLHLRGMQAQANAVANRIFPHPSQSALRGELIRQVLAANPSAYRAAMSTLAKINLDDRLIEISQPTLVITGECDTTVLPHIQTAMTTKIRNARQVIMPNTGHAASVENYAVFNGHLLDFLSASPSHRSN